MNARRLVQGLFAGVALFALPAALPAQTVVGVQNLDFGSVIPGVPTTVAPTDAVRAGQFRISGVFIRNVTVSFVLPTVMNGPLGATMPITFANTDGGYSTFLQGNTPFNPHTPYNETVVFNATIVLGGRVNPTPTQRGGAYSANIVITVIFL
jgi:hypothetical protein